MGDCFSAYPSAFESLNMRVVELLSLGWFFVGASPPARLREGTGPPSSSPLYVEVASSLLKQLDT